MGIADFQSFSAASLSIFFVFTVLVTVWVFRPNSKQTYKKIANDVLED